MNFKSYFSDLSCLEEFEIKCSLLGKKKNDPEILKCFKKIESWYFLVVNKRIVFLDKEGNKVDGKDIEIKGDLDVSFLEIESLEGCPKKVKENFYCNGCSGLKSLEGCPKKVGGSFDCSYCLNLTSLEGCPEETGRNFFCYNCLNLESLKGSPRKVGEVFYCYNCQNLKSFDGCPKEVGGHFYCKNCQKIPETEIPDCEIRGKLYR